MKKFLQVVFAILVCFSLSFARPQIAKSMQGSISGTVQGRIIVRDNRNLESSAHVPVRHVVVAVTALPAPSGGELQYINPTFFAITDNNGNFSSSWQDGTRNAFPTRLRIAVLWEFSNELGVQNVAPTPLFRIRHVDPYRNAQSVFIRNVRGNSIDLGALIPDANDETAAYLTTQEFFQRIVLPSQILRERMAGLVVKTRVPSFNSSFGVAPFPREVLISEGTPVQRPLVLAHELGHAVTWNALDLNSAPLNPATDYTHPAGGLAPRWSLQTREYSKAAFLEGFAEAWALEWVFGSDVAAVLEGAILTFNFETGRVTLTGTTVTFMNCALINNAHEFPFCHTAALRDLLDSNDTVDLTHADLIDILDRFQNGISNGQRDELGVDALNHHDFRCNALGAARRVAIRRIWSLNGINGGPSSFCMP